VLGRSRLLILALVLLGNSLVWGLAGVVSSPGTPRTLPGVAFSPFGRRDDPFAGRYPTEGQIEQDLKVLREHVKVKALRTYGSSHGLERIPVLAGKYGFRVSAGVWLDKDLAAERGRVAQCRRLRA
jgi:Exo-beta-1,3-glucanase